MSKENFWILFSKKMAGEATDRELQELEQLIQDHPEWQYALQNLEVMWETKAPFNLAEEEDAYLLHYQLMKEKNISFDEETAPSTYSPAVKWYTRKSLLRTLYATGGVAAACLILFVLVRNVWTGNKSNTPAVREVNEIITQVKSRSRVQLPDKSIVWLNAGSRLTYNKDFGKSGRQVELYGEAFFDVTHNADLPFQIQTSSITIKVLGTAFNVKAYPEDETSETTLIRGSIEVSFKKRPKDKIILSPNEKLIVDNNHAGGRDSTGSPANAPLVTINKLPYNKADSTIAEMQWIHNILVFKNESLAELAVKMERWYGVQIEIADERLKEKKFTGSFSNENIEQAMEALTFSTPFQFSIHGNKIIIHQ